MNEEDSDDALLRRLATGDLQALGALYDRYAPRVYQYLCVSLESREDAEDALQEVFLSLMQLGGKARRVRNLRTYLLVAARHQAASLFRQRKIQQRGLDGAGTLMANPSGRAECELSWQVQEALRELPVAQREVVILKVWWGMTFQEIGNMLGLSLNTAASRYRYALEKLRESLGGREDE